MENIIAECLNKSSLYAGEVTVTLRHGKTPYLVIKHHNAGTSDFFKYLLECAIGAAGPEQRPGYLRIFSDKDYSAQILYDFIYSGQPVVSSTEAQATTTITFMIPDSIALGKTILSMELMSMDKTKKVYAQVDISQTPITITAKTNVIIEWKLFLQNATN